MNRSAKALPPHVKLLGTSGSASAYSIRDFLQRSDVPFEWVELTSDEDARNDAGVADLRDGRLPVCVFADGTRIECPTIRQITERLGWFRDPSRSEYDLAIYGAGPAGLSAAVYGASEGLKTVVIERSAIGGQAGTSSKIENYLGFPKGISGADLAERAREQACRFGAEFLIAREGVRGEFMTGKGVGYLADGTKIVARATVCATGVQYKRLDLPRESEYLGRGLYYGAGASEASFCGNEHVFVIGGGNSAGQAAMHFSKYARKVTMIIRGSSLKSTLSNYLIERILASPSLIEVRPYTEVTSLDGEHGLQAITLTDRQTGQQETIATRWLFVCIGGAPHTDWAGELGIIRDSEGYLVTGPDLLHAGANDSWPLDRDPYYLESSMPGLFAAGDVRHGSIKRCASAVGEGAMAVAFVHRYLAAA